MYQKFLDFIITGGRFILFAQPHDALYSSYGVREYPIVNHLAQSTLENVLVLAQTHRSRYSCVLNIFILFYFIKAYTDLF
jgi:hypothetical protein